MVWNLNWNVVRMALGVDGFTSGVQLGWDDSTGLKHFREGYSIQYILVIVMKQIIIITRAQLLNLNKFRTFRMINENTSIKISFIDIF